MYDRELVLEMLKRYREAMQQANRLPEGSSAQIACLARAQAFDEIYTELKGRGFDGKSL